MNCRTISSVTLKNPYQIGFLGPLRSVPPPVCAERRVQVDLHPLAIRDSIAGGAVATAFPYVDSRLRYWRYYLLIGPQAPWDSPSILANRALRVLRDNKGQRKGVGEKLFKKYRGNVPIKTLGRSLKQYRRAIETFWDEPNGALMKAARDIRKLTSLQGFFANMKDGHARRSFHAAFRNQSVAASEIASRFRHGRELNEASTKFLLGHSSSADAQRLVLARATLRILYRVDPPTEDISDDVLVDDDTELRSLAEATLSFLASKTGIGLLANDRLRQELRRVIESGRRRGYDFVPPLVPPPLATGRMRQLLFANLRLNTFHKIVMETMPGQNGEDE